MTAELPLKDIDEADIDDNDILLGRGGKTNHHPGNASYLKLIEARQVEYMFLESRTEKTEYAMHFVQQLRKEGIRFLKKDDKDGKKWSDVGDTKMREKVSQNLREHQPKLKKQLAEQQKMKEMQQQQQVHQQMPMPNLNQQTSNFSVNSQSSQQMQPLNGCSLSPMQQQRPYVDPQALLQQQQFYQMQAMAQQNQLQSQQQFQQLLHQQQQMANGSQFPGYNSPMMAQQAQIMSNPMMNNSGINPLPFANDMSSGQGQWNNRDEQERGLLDMVSAGQHRLSSSNSPLPETVESQQPYDDGDMPLHNIARPSIAKRIATLTDMDVAVAMQGDMGESTHSILDTLNVDPVPEEIDGDEFGGDEEDDPLSSPKPNHVAIDQITPVLSNKPRVMPYNDPATVTPTPNSPKQKNSANVCVLDNDMLAAWASTADDEDAFTKAIGGNVAGGAPFRRSSTNPENSPKPSGGGFRRMVTAPAPAQDPFRSASPHPPRKAQSHGPTTSPRPTALTMSKRGTSNVNDTPETRGHLKFQEGPLADEFTDSFSSDPSREQSSSSWSGSVKKVMKASLGRDKSAQSRLLKQQCMPYAYGPATGSYSSTGSMSASYNGWPANIAINSNDDPTNSPTPNGNKTTNTVSDVTPKTQRVLQDFGKMTLTQAAEKGLSPKQGHARTAQKFEDTIAEKAEKLPMELMVNKPAPLQWRNRTTTIEALDLDSLEDDNVLREERGEGKADGEETGSRRPSRSSFSSIAGMWADMPTSEEFETLVSDIAGQQVTDLGLDQPSMGKQGKAPANLALPNLKA